MSNKKNIKVTAALLKKGGLFLLAQRKKGSRFEGLWEFPGGKIEPGEDPKACLQRELFEEFAIETVTGDLFHSHSYEYDFAIVELFTYETRHVGGEFQLLDHQAMQWVTPQQMKTMDLVPADREIAEKLLIS